jgi:predicted phosphodiesterase
LSMLVAVTADLHGRWVEAVDFAEEHRCEAILVAGDLGEAAYGAPWPMPVYWVWGDDDSRLVWQHVNRARQVRNCQLIPNWSTVSVDGLVVLGVGAERDNAARPGPAVVLPPSDPIPGADLLLSHAAGWHRRVSTGSHTYDVYDEQVSRAIRESGAQVALSGHHHRWLAGRTNHGRTRCYGLSNGADGWAVLDTRTLRVSRPKSWPAVAQQPPKRSWPG